MSTQHPGTAARTILLDGRCGPAGRPVCGTLLATEYTSTPFAIAANVLLSFIPFCVLCWCFARTTPPRMTRYWPCYAITCRTSIRNIPTPIHRAQHEYIGEVAEIRSHLRICWCLLATARCCLGSGSERIWRIPKDRSWLNEPSRLFWTGFSVRSLAFLSVIIAGAHLAAVH